MMEEKRLREGQRPQSILKPRLVTRASFRGGGRLYRRSSGIVSRYLLPRSLPVDDVARGTQIVPAQVVP